MFPFTLDNNKDYTGLKIDKFYLSEESVWKPLNMKTENYVFFTHIQSFLQKSVTGTVGQLNEMKSCELFVYSIDDKKWGGFFRDTFVMSFNGKDRKFIFPNNTKNFESPKLIVYPDSSVGILIIPIEIECDRNTLLSMDELMEFNYHFHKIDKSQQPILTFPINDIKALKGTSFYEEKKNGFFKRMKDASELLCINYAPEKDKPLKNYDPEKDEPLKFHLLQLVERLLASISTPYTLTNQKRCHVFTYMHSIDDEDLTDFEQENFLRISRCENNKYQIINRDKSIFQTFKNIYLAVNVEGGAMLSCGSSPFFKGFKTDTLQQRYMWLYILSIVQRYSLINISRALGGIDDTNDMHKIVSIRKLRNLSDQLTRIKVNTYFSDISDYQQHNDFYQFCIEGLGVKRLFASMDHKMETLANCLEQKADKNSEDLQLLLAFFVAILTIFSGCNDGFQLFNRLFSMSPNPSLPFIIYCVVFVLACLFTFLMICKYRKELGEIISSILHFWK